MSEITPSEKRIEQLETELTAAHEQIEELQVKLAIIEQQRWPASYWLGWMVLAVFVAMIILVALYVFVSEVVRRAPS